MYSTSIENIIFNFFCGILFDIFALIDASGTENAAINRKFIMLT